MRIFRTGYKGAGHPGAVLIIIPTIYTCGIGGGTGSANKLLSISDVRRLYRQARKLIVGLSLFDELIRYGRGADPALS